MTDGSDHPAEDRRTRPSPSLSPRARLEWLQRRLMRLALIRGFLEVQRAYDRAGGAVTSAGLAFYALFTLSPALLLMAGLLGFIVDDEALRQEILAQVVAQIPPLEDVARVVLEGLAGGAQTGTLLGLAGLLWGSSGFYGALQGAMQRMFPGPAGTRDLIRTRLFGLVSLGLVMCALLAAVVVSLTVPLANELLRVDLGQVSAVLAPVVACGVGAVTCLLVYVAVPTDGPGVRVALLPAVLAGTVIGLLTSTFGVLGPLLVRSAPALGLLGTVFVSLVWLNLVFQALLYGAAAARLGRDRRRRFESITGP